ncbi:MAG: hypothetical protein KAH21_01325 [Spirochaetaceae bacterium]|nr:hypothetical protein [Spirochaetaceae bacterium]
MFPKVFFLIATILSVLSTLNIPAISASEESVVTEIIIEGNRRSKDRYILSIIEISVGDKWYPGIEEEVKQNLLDEMLFQRETLKISSEKDGSGYRLHIYVEDRWTLLPIPVGSVSSDQWMAGLMLVERNFLGRGIMLNAGFIYGSDMMLGILMLGSENLTFGGGYMMSDREELTTAGGEAKVLRQYNLAMPYSFLKPSYRMRDWRFSWVFRYQGASVDWISGEAGVPIAEGNHYFITGPTISYSGLTHQSIFAKGFKADVSGLYYTPAYGSIVAGGSYAFFL